MVCLRVSNLLHLFQSIGFHRWSSWSCGLKRCQAWEIQPKHTATNCHFDKFTPPDMQHQLCCACMFWVSLCAINWAPDFKMNTCQRWRDVEQASYQGCTCNGSFNATWLCHPSPDSAFSLWTQLDMLGFIPPRCWGYYITKVTEIIAFKLRSVFRCLNLRPKFANVVDKGYEATLMTAHIHSGIFAVAEVLVVLQQSLCAIPWFEENE